MKRQVADFVEVSPVVDVLWAGSAIMGASVHPGSLAPIALSVRSRHVNGYYRSDVPEWPITVSRGAKAEFGDVC